MTTYLARHPNARKPDIPYTVGATLNVQEHQPDPLLNRRTRDYATSEAYQHAEYAIHPVDLCHRYPPSPGQMGERHNSLRISDTINVGDGHRSQILKVYSEHHSRYLVAKIYDPLYWDFQQGGMNQFACCDTDYRSEVRAYLQLSPLYETVVPRYYGSWSMNIDTDPGKPPRQVRLILMELIYGDSLESLDPHKFSHSERKEIMAKVAYAETMLRHHDVLHTDQHPRNFLYTRSPSSSGGKARIVVIDFEAAAVGQLSASNVLPGITDATTLSRAIERTWTVDSLRDRFRTWLEDLSWPHVLRQVVRKYDLRVVPG